MNAAPAIREFFWQIAAKVLPGLSTFNSFRICHPERSEGPAVSCDEKKAGPSLRSG
jgi:hypothetical protein